MYSKAGRFSIANWWLFNGSSVYLKELFSAFCLPSSLSVSIAFLANDFISFSTVVMVSFIKVMFDICSMRSSSSYTSGMTKLAPSARSLVGPSSRETLLLQSLRSLWQTLHNETMTWLDLNTAEGFIDKVLYNRN